MSTKLPGYWGAGGGEKGQGGRGVKRNDQQDYMYFMAVIIQFSKLRYTFIDIFISVLEDISGLLHTPHALLHTTEAAAHLLLQKPGYFDAKIV